MLAANGDPVDWVTRRANCDLEGVFHSLLSQVQSDVEKFKSYPAKKLRGYTFNFSSIKAFAAVNRLNGERDQATVKFELKEQEISISSEGLHHVVTKKWDHETATCLLFLDGKRQEVWQISQAALYNLFFE